MICKLPKKGETLRVKCGKRILVVKKSQAGRDWVLSVGNRVRWGNKRQTCSDIAYFRESCTLPAKGRRMW